MDIVSASLPDIDDLVQISRETFYDSFHHLNKPENMDAYMNHAFDRERLLSELCNKQSEFYLAKDGKKVIGYMKVNKKEAQTEFKGDNSLEIERIYIVNGHQGKSKGSRLLEKARQIARASNIEYIWLGVWEKNPDAIRFYERNGFKVFSEHEFQMGDEVQMDKLMICKL